MGSLLAHGTGDLHPGGLHQLQNLGEAIVVRVDPDHEHPFFLGLAGAAPGEAGEFFLQSLHLGLEIEIERVDVARLEPLEELVGVGGDLFVGCCRRDHRHLDTTRLAVFSGLHHGHRIETQQGQVVEIVGGERFATQVGMHEAQATETPHTSAQATDVGQVQGRGVAHHHIADVTLPPDHHSDLAPELPRDLGQVPGQLSRHHFPGRDLASIGPLQSFFLRGLDALEIAVDMCRDGRFPRSLGSIRSLADRGK